MFNDVEFVDGGGGAALFGFEEESPRSEANVLVALEAVDDTAGLPELNTEGDDSRLELKRFEDDEAAGKLGDAVGGSKENGMGALLLVGVPKPAKPANLGGGGVEFCAKLNSGIRVDRAKDRPPLRNRLQLRTQTKTGKMERGILPSVAEFP